MIGEQPPVVAQNGIALKTQSCRRFRVQVRHHMHVYAKCLKIRGGVGLLILNHFCQLRASILHRLLRDRNAIRCQLCSCWACTARTPGAGKGKLVESNWHNREACWSALLFASAGCRACTAKSWAVASPPGWPLSQTASGHVLFFYVLFFYSTL